MKNKLISFAEILKSNGFAKLGGKLLAQVGIEPPTGGGSAGEYNITGNEYYTSRDTDLEKTRQKELRKKIKNKKNEIISLLRDCPVIHGCVLKSGKVSTLMVRSSIYQMFGNPIECIEELAKIKLELTRDIEARVHFGDPSYYKTKIDRIKELINECDLEYQELIEGANYPIAFLEQVEKHYTNLSKLSLRKVEELLGDSKDAAYNMILEGIILDKIKASTDKKELVQYALSDNKLIRSATEKRLLEI